MATVHEDVSRETERCEHNEKEIMDKGWNRLLLTKVSRF